MGSVMTRRTSQHIRNATPAKNNAAVSGQRNLRPMAGKRARGVAVSSPRTFLPPESWYEPTGEVGGSFEVIVQKPGEGYRHIVSPADVVERLAKLPSWMLEGLNVVQLSQMTRKKRAFPCYGMQWGSTIYLYPVEIDLVETFPHPPKPAQRIEAKQYGARWRQTDGLWRLVWSEEAIRDFYLNNILIHELGHLIDARNTSYVDRERYAEWFALEYGYKASRREQLAKKLAAKIAGKT